ncbi:MAG: hypothetical protein ABFR53_06955 [Actinomycetota bacterium]
MDNGIEATARTLLWIALTVPLALLWVAVFVDLFRRKDLRFTRKAMWGAIVVFTIHIGVLVYFILRPIPPPHGKRARDTQDRASAIVESMEQLHTQHAAGDISDDAYLGAKRELLGLGEPRS